jgi:hypothetical protein
MDDRFRISAVMATPVIITSYATLDGLLGAMLFDQLQDVDAAHAAIPIRTTDGLSTPRRPGCWESRSRARSASSRAFGPRTTSTLT